MHQPPTAMRSFLQPFWLPARGLRGSRLVGGQDPSSIDNSPAGLGCRPAHTPGPACRRKNQALSQAAYTLGVGNGLADFTLKTRPPETPGTSVGVGCQEAGPKNQRTQTRGLRAGELQFGVMCGLKRGKQGSITLRINYMKCTQQGTSKVFL